MVDFTSLVQPQEFTTPLAIMITFLFGIIANAGLKLKSPFVMFIFSLTVIVFILTFVAGMSFLWFWIMIAVNFLAIVIASIVRYML